MLSREESEKRRHEAIGPRVVRTVENGAAVRADPSLEDITESRWVVRGFLERALSMLRKDAPTGSNDALSALLQIVASARPRLEQGDIEGAYLSGDGINRCVYIRQPAGGIPCVEPGLLLRAKKGPYGLVDAARQFFLYLRSVLVDAGFTQSVHDPVLFSLNGADGRIEGVCLTHVDGLMLGWRESSCVAGQAKNVLQGTLKFGKYHIGNLTRCGREYRQLPDDSVEAHMDTCLSQMSPVRISRGRRGVAHKGTPCTEAEHGQFRSLIGQLMSVERDGLPLGAPLVSLGG